MESQQSLWLHGSGGALSLPELRVPGGAVAEQVVVVAGQLLTLTHLNKQQDDQVGKCIWKTTFEHLVRTMQTYSLQTTNYVAFQNLRKKQYK